MKRIIGGRLYDTDTAEEVGQGRTTDEWESWEIDETLYRKKTGEFFIWRDMFGDGDAVDVYNWVIAHRLEPLSLDQAKAWVEKYLEVEEYCELFGVPEE